MIYIFYALTILLILNSMKVKKILEQNEIVLTEQRGRINELERMNEIQITKKESQSEEVDEIIKKAEYKKELIGKVAHIFDNKNEWIGYEFITEISPTQTVIKYISHEGRLQKIKHVFDKAPYDSKTDEEFNQYMKSVKSKALIYNSDYLSDANLQSIDLKSSVDEAKIYRKCGV